MRLFLLFFIILNSWSVFSQRYCPYQLIGNWKVKDVKIKKMTIISCNPEVTKPKLEDYLKEEYIGAIFVLYSTNKLTYYSKDSNHVTDNNPLVLTELINFEWQVLDDGKIELINPQNNSGKSAISLKYNEGQLYFNLFGIEMRTEKI